MEDPMMTVDNVTKPWTIRSTLVAVADLERSVAFYRELGPFEEIAREDAVAVLGDVASASDVVAASIVLILRETRSLHHTRHGQESLGLRSITFNVGSGDELDRVEAVLRRQERFTSRQRVADGVSELLRGRDPDNLPLVFICYAEGKAVGADYYRTIANLVYSLDT
jgi:hypothetical protein